VNKTLISIFIEFCNRKINEKTNNTNFKYKNRHIRIKENYSVEHINSTIKYPRKHKKKEVLLDHFREIENTHTHTTKENKKQIL
jgi:hypothetical protein